jgi:hypothetical protein
MKIKLKSLEKAFEKALELAFREVPFEDRLKATERALEAFRLPKDLVLEAALPGAFHGSIRGVPGGPSFLKFIRYGSVVLKAGRGAPPLWPEDEGSAAPEGTWARGDLVTPLAAPSRYWTRYPLPFPRPLLEGVERALASLAKEAGVSPPPPLPEAVAFVGGPVRAGDLVLVNIGIFIEYDPFDHDLEPRLLVLGPGGALLVDPWKGWDAWAKALQKMGRGAPAHITQKTLAALLEGEGSLDGEAVLKALRDPKLFRLLRLARL